MFRTMQDALRRKRDPLPFYRDYGRLVKRVVEAPGPERNLGSAAWWGEDGLIHGIHLTDDPSAVEATLRSSVPLAAKHTMREDLGPGLYISGAPQIWVGRATSKWDFLKTLEAPEAKPLRLALATAIAQDSKLKDTYYLSTNERKRAGQSLDRYVEDGSEYVVYLAGQPYNIRFWEPRFLEPLGIRPGTQPIQIEVVLRGRLAELNHHPDDDQIRALHNDPTLDGAFTPGGFASEPQLVVWNNDAVVSFG